MPGWRRCRRRQFEQCIDRDATLLVPLGVVLEAGNHIAQLGNGDKRWHHAKKFQNQMGKALAGEVPWNLVPLPDREQLNGWLNAFPESAEREAGLVDLSIIKEWEAACRRHSLSRVRIWSLDDHLKGYDRRAG